jgi:hypothetical protein
VLGEALRLQGKFERAERFLHDGWPQHDTRLHHLRNLRALFNLARLYEQWNDAEPTSQRAEQASKWRKKYDEYYTSMKQAGVRIRPKLVLE